MKTTWKRFLLVLAFSVMAFSVLAQPESDSKKAAYAMLIEAIELMDDGKIEESIELLEKAQKVDPEDDIIYPYEIALAYTKKEDYKQSIKILKKLLKRDDVYDQVYQLLGNSYSLSGKAKKAIATYEKGLSLFPASGPLHLERGTMELKEDRLDKALYFYEKGIAVQPTFASNYFWTSRIYALATHEEVWGMIYGEIFMNLEFATERTYATGELLFNTYQNEITLTNDSQASVSFSRNQLNIDEIKIKVKGKEPTLPFPLKVYEPLMLLSVLGETEINLASLNRIRAKFLSSYFENGFNDEYPNILFEFQKEILDAGHFEAYNYWLLGPGDEEAFDQWRTENEEDWAAFVEWFSDNDLEIDDQVHYFHRSQY